MRARPVNVYRRSFRRLRIDEHEGDAAHFFAAVDPGMVGALLYQHVAGLQMDLVSSSSMSISPKGR